MTHDLNQNMLPLPNADEEKIVQQIASNILSKPGFIRNATTKDTLERGLRSLLLKVDALRSRNAA